jgi:hypothetical protein
MHCEGLSVLDAMKDDWSFPGLQLSHQAWEKILSGNEDRMNDMIFADWDQNWNGWDGEDAERNGDGDGDGNKGRGLLQLAAVVLKNAAEVSQVHKCGLLIRAMLACPIADMFHLVGYVAVAVSNLPDDEHEEAQVYWSRDCFKFHIRLGGKGRTLDTLKWEDGTNQVALQPRHLLCHVQERLRELAP